MTICTQGRQKLFGDVGADSISARMLKAIWEETLALFPTVQCSKFVIMPNHFHAIIEIQRADMESAPTLSEVVQTFKRYSTIEYARLVKQGAAAPFDKRVWQRSFHDHILRNERGYHRVWEYIDTNPQKWEQDCFYIP